MGYPIAEMPGVDVAADARDTRAGAATADAAAAIGRPKLRAVTPLAARAARLACDARLVRRLASDLGVDGWEVTVRDAHDAGVLRFEAPGMLELAHPGGEVRVLFDLAAYPALGIAAQPESGAAPTPGDAARALRTAVAGVLLATLLERLATLGLPGMHVARLVRCTSAQSAAHAHAAIDLRFTLDGVQREARVLIAAPVREALQALEAVQAIQATRAAQATATRAIDAHAAPHAGLVDCLVPGRLILGSRRLPVATLRELATGDVLLRSLAGDLRALMPAQSAAGVRETPAGAPTAIAAWGSPGLVRVHAPAAIEGLKLTITKEPTMADELDPVRPDDLLAPDEEGNPIDIGELDLPVQFEIDTVALPLSQLYALRPGYVLELPTPVEQARLKLVTHGQTIGYGELVTVGDHLGIRILRMAHGDGPVQ